MAKVLLLPTGVGLAHTGRLIMIARELQKMGVTVIFGAGGDAPAILAKEKLFYEPLPDFDRETYERMIKNNTWDIYSISLINKFVKSEVELIKKLNPDLIVFDLRITAIISSRITKKPSVSIINVDATRFYDLSKIKIPHKSYLGKFLPGQVTEFFDKERGQRILRRLAPRIAKTLFLKLLLKFNYVLAKNHLKPILDPYDLSLGDLTLLADIQEFRPVKNLPQNVKLVGPIFWDGINKLPHRADKLNKKNNIIYVTASGTGDKDIFLKVLDYLKDSSFTIVATTGNTLARDNINIRYPNLYVTDYLPGSWIMERAKLIIFPGGNATSYQALNYGVPQIGIPLHLDQEDNMNQLVRLKTGIMILPDKLTKETFLRAIDRILKEKSFAENAKKISRKMQKYDGAKQAAEEIIKFLK